MTPEARLALLSENLPVTSGWFETIRSVMPDASSPDERMKKKLTLMGRGYLRLYKASDVFSTFPPDYRDYGSLFWVDVRATLDEADTAYSWLVDQSWNGSVGFGWIEDEPKFSAVNGYFGVFNDERDYMHFRLRWS